MLSKEEKQIKKSFPELETTKIREFHKVIKSDIVSYTNDNLIDMVTNRLVEKIMPCLNTSNHDKVKKKCKKLVATYWEYNKQDLLQENWFCLLAYCISIATMICRILEMNTKNNDLASFIFCFVALLIWIAIVNTKKMMNNKVSHFLECFNRCAPSMTIISNTIFYFILLRELENVLLCVVTAGSLVITMAATILVYNRTK